MAAPQPAGASKPRASESSIVTMGVVAVVVALVLLTVGINLLNFDVIAGILTVMTLTVVTVPALRAVARAEKDPGLLTIMYWALAAKVVGTLIRYFFITQVYGDNGDAGVYHGAGAILVDLYRQGIFTLHVGVISARGAETERIAVVLAIVYLFTGVSRYAGSFAFAWLCFAGQVLMYRAFKVGVPEGDHRRYAYLVLFLPSMLFWPSSIGKESLMVFCIGLVCYGASKILGKKVQTSGIVVFLLGAAGLFFIRPHMAMISVTALAFAAAVSTVVGFRDDVASTEDEDDKKAKSRAFAVRMGALVLLIGAAAVATTQVSKVLGDGTQGAEGLSGVLARTEAQTATGGSQFTPPTVTSPLDIPWATITVLFRPFPWEAKSANGVIASLEGMLLLTMMIIGRRRILAWARTLGKRPYLVYALAFAMTFVIAFSYIGNFGILARQRTQMLPLGIIMLGMPIATRTRASLFGRKANAVDETAVRRKQVAQTPLAGPRLQFNPVRGAPGLIPPGESRP